MIVSLSITDTSFTSWRKRLCRVALFVHFCQTQRPASISSLRNASNHSRSSSEWIRICSIKKSNACSSCIASISPVCGKRKVTFCWRSPFRMNSTSSNYCSTERVSDSRSSPIRIVVVQYEIGLTASIRRWDSVRASLLSRS